MRGQPIWRGHGQARRVGPAEHKRGAMRSARKQGATERWPQAFDARKRAGQTGDALADRVHATGACDEFASARRPPSPRGGTAAGHFYRASHRTRERCSNTSHVCKRDRFPVKAGSLTQYLWEDEALRRRDIRMGRPTATVPPRNVGGGFPIITLLPRLGQRRGSLLCQSRWRWHGSWL
jgi:hypothetical protein